MKRILLISTLVAASTGAFAQSKTPVAPATTSPAQAQQASVSRELSPSTPVSKNAFVEQVKQLDLMIASNRADDAKNKWNDVSNMMMNSLRDMAGKVKMANANNNEEEKKRVIEQMTKQRMIYAEAMRLREDMATNRVKLNEKLNEFTTVMAQ